MPRLARVSPLGVAQHVIQRGNNRQICFGGEEDMDALIIVYILICAGCWAEQWVDETNNL
jgi:putative transposase